LSAQANASPQKIGRYEVVGELGKGAMGIVYKALDPMIGRTVAMKTMRMDVHGMEADEMLKRFQNEARAAGVLNHPNIVTIYDAGEQDGLFYIAMEFIEGVTLHSLILQNRVLPVDQVIDFSRQICAGLDQAHAHSVIHRDVKPANIMILPDNKTIKIMDFGIAKAGGGLTSAGQVLGTPNYMSPEQVKGRTLDGRSDLFSFGVMLYEMVTGEKPFTGQNVTTIIYKIVNENPIPPRELDVTIHPGLSAVITKALAKSPDERYQNGAELIKDLTNYKAFGTATDSAMSTGAAASAAALNANASDKTVAFDSGAMAKMGSGSMPASPAPAAPVAAATPAAPVSAAASPALKAIDSTVDLAKKKLAPAVAAAKKDPKKGALAGVALVVILALLGGGMYVRHRSAAQQAAAEEAQRQADLQKTAQDAQARVNQAIQNAPAPAVTEPAPDQPSATPAKPAASANTKTPATTRPGTKPSPQVQQAKAGQPTPATAAPAQPQPSATTGELQVSSNPAGAQLQVDGAIQQSSPFTFRNLTPGQHTVVISKTGFATETRRIDVAVGKTTPLVVNLNAVPTSTITAASEPSGAHILIDGKDTGKVTPATVTVDPGAHKIILRKDGFRDATMSTPTLKAGGGFDFRPFLQAGKNDENPFKRLFGGVPAGMGAVNLKTTPKGATILMNGYSAPKTTPYKLALDPGNYQITLKLDGYKPVTKAVAIEKGKTQELDIPLEKQ
jgi:serine/threonine-protein kinase